MKVLVTVASRHGSTMLIGDAIREELAAKGITTHLVEPDLVRDITPYDAVVLGSAVYGGRWLAPARKFVDRFAAELVRKPVWLFSSGPIGDPAKPTQPPAEAMALTQRLNARDHQVFEGRLDRDQLSFGERATVRVVGAESGDFRPWTAITVWALAIASELESELATPAGAG
jgi:menaquinone-dependent protoporphyrinogen oxidase